MTLLGRSQRARRRVVGVKPYRAVLGDASDTVEAGNGEYWVRPYDAANENNVSTLGAAYRVRAGSNIIVPRAGFVVWVGQGLDRRLTVQAYDHDDMVAKGINPTAIQPNNPYRQWIRLKDIQNFRALPVATSPTPSMKVSVRQLFYYTNTGDLVRWNGTNADTHIDLTSYVPGEGLQRYVVLWLRAYNPNNVSPIQVTVSTPISSINAILSFDDLQECATASDADTIPIQAFRLANAQTTLKLDDTTDVDLRQFINMPQVWGFPNTVTRAYRLHEGFSVVAPSAIAVEEGGLIQIQDNALLMILGGDNDTGGGTDTGITQLTGDVTAGPGSGSQAATLATVNSSPGNHAAADITVNAKGLVTAAASAASTGSGSIVRTSSPTIVTPTIASFTNAQHDHANAAGGGQLTDAALSAAVGIAKGGTGQTTKTDAFDALAPTTAAGDTIYFNGTDNTRLAKGAAYDVYRMDQGDTAPEWSQSITVAKGTSGEGLTALYAVFLSVSDGKWYLIDTDSTTPLIGSQRGVVIDAGGGGTNASIVVVQCGPVGGFGGLTPGLPLYAQSTPGFLDTAKPSLVANAAQVAICVMGYVMSSTTIFVNPQPISYMKKASIAANGTLSIIHQADDSPYLRLPSATSDYADTSLTETYASSNQDADATLKRLVATTIDAAGATSVALGDNAGNDLRPAQSFTPSTTGTLTSFSWATGTTSGTPTGTIGWKLCPDTGGIPDTANIIASGTIGSWTASSTMTVNVTSGPTLTNGTTYWIIWELSAMQATNVRYSIGLNTAGAYASGVAKWDIATGSSFPNTWTGGGGANDLRMTVNTLAYDRIAQGIKVSTNSELYSAKLWLKRVGTPTDDLTVTMFSSTGAPPGTPNAALTNGVSAVVNAATLSTSYGYIEFLFGGLSISPILAASTQYHIVLSTTSTGSLTNYVVWGIDTSSPSYANGVLKTDISGTWSATPTADGCFVLYKFDSTVTEGVVVGRWSGGTRDMAVRFDDGTAGSNTTTQTTFKNTSGARALFTCRVILD